MKFLQALTAILLFVLSVATGCFDRVDVERVEARVPVAEARQDTTIAGTDPAPDTEIPDPWFHTMENVGIDFQHTSGTSPEKPFPAANGSGIAAIDYDLDGFCDLYFATGTPFPIDRSRTSPTNRCYRNLGGWTFQDVTAQCGLGHNGFSAGIACGDYDSDGFPDVYVACYGANVLYHNMGDGTFEPLTSKSGAADEQWATSAAMFDFDGDALLDIYVCNYGQWSLAENRWCGDPARDVRYYCSPRTIKPVRDALLRNDGDGSFADATETAGLSQRAGRTQGVVAADLDGNGTVDLYLGNDLNANSLFLNQGDGHFQDATELSGVAYDYLGGMQAGMGVDAADTNGDGLPELFVTNFAGEHNAYYENLGSGLFQEVSQQRGLYSDGLPWVGWGTALADFNLDGQIDLVVTNGHVDDNRASISYAHPALLWQNQGQGRFTFLGKRGGRYFSQPHVGRALVVADLNNDGAQDLVIGHQDGLPAVLRNEHRTETGRSQPKIALRLIGTRSNRDAIGTSITLRADEHWQVLQVNAGGSYLSAHDVRKVFAVTANATRTRLEIRWPDGFVSKLDDLAPNASYTVVQPLSAESATRVFTQGAFMHE